MTLLQIRSNGQITLPASIRRLAQLKEGDTVEVQVDEDGTIHLIPKLGIFAYSPKKVYSRAT